jgi:hypothetical protein
MLEAAVPLQHCRSSMISLLALNKEYNQNNAEFVLATRTAGLISVTLARI